jgi:hypothetical protein
MKAINHVSKHVYFTDTFNCACVDVPTHQRLSLLKAGRRRLSVAYSQKNLLFWFSGGLTSAEQVCMDIKSMMSVLRVSNKTILQVTRFVRSLLKLQLPSRPKSQHNCQDTITKISQLVTVSSFKI